ncbi:ArsR/SmtB family transcription factor [Nonomuraea turcica]|uniref:ArsR/SmtB family transcription factor n=1 Tax=Nonomuraea sp. G32 TaxID=3067274 RepID=UPI00273B8A1C|nr:metalloregulator ArsR/SmtB family transcription factor [Nonomuraea sp. G32]MDP4511554.1 metalloregulator ArsR/SmtB family transcription factor [Nonomuraea sp. G32]
MRNPDTARLRAFAHPLRLRILSLLTGTSMSATELARELGDTQANVSYHLRMLHQAGLVEVAEEVSVRGGKAKRYSHDPSSGANMPLTIGEEQVLMAVALSTELRRRADSFKPGSRNAIVDADLWVTPELWSEIRTAALELARRLHAGAMPPHASGAVRTSTTMALFEMGEQ